MAVGGGLGSSRAMDPALSDSALALAGQIRRGERSSREIVEAHIARVEAVNPRLNAVVAARFEQARAEADDADRRVQAGADGLPPLWGVPCTIKESFALEGMPNSSGLLSRARVVAERDAVTVARLRSAGAIPLGVTNTSELCMWMESANRVYGRTGNAYDPRRIAGGSSGGEGAIVGAGGSPFGLGADIGGSIRMPAFFNGVFGHKPTGGLVPGTGQYPLSQNDALRYLCTGPIARRAEDLMPLLRILAGPDGEDAECRPIPLGDPGEVSIAELTVLDVRGNGAVRVSDELQTAQAGAAEALARLGARVETTRLPGLEHSLDLWSSMMHAAASTPYAELLGAGRRVWAVLELLRWLVGRSPYTLPSIGLVALERLSGLAEGRVARFVELGRRLKAELAARLGPRVVMLYPSYPSSAPRHGWPLLWPIRWQYTAVINVLELPATQVPLGLGRGGLPLGVQVVGLHGHDHVTIAVAQALERSLGGWVPPPAA